MRPEPGGASYFTLLVANQLGALCAELDRPVTLDELVEAVMHAPGTPTAYVTQRYQQHLCQANKGHNERLYGTTEPGSVPYGYDSALGWHYEGFDPNDPRQLRAAFRHITNKRIGLTRRARVRHWVIFHPGEPERYERSTTEHPIVVTDGKKFSWDEQAQAQADAGSAFAVSVINQSGFQDRLTRAAPDVAAGVYHWLTSVPRIANRNQGQYRQLLREAKQVVKDDPDAALTILRDVLNARLPT